MHPVLSTERIAHLGAAGDYCAAGFQLRLCRLGGKMRRTPIERILSAFPPLATEKRTFGIGRSRPKTAVSSRSKTTTIPWSPPHLVLSFERQPEDELTIHRHDGVEVETDMVVDRRHVAPSALKWMALLQAAATGGIEDQVYRRLSLIRDKRLGTPTEKPNRH